MGGGGVAKIFGRSRLLNSTEYINHLIDVEDENPLRVTGKIVITDSDVCLLREVIGMLDISFYGSTLVKKHGYCPTVIYVYGINAYFDQK